jgi:hypothetical protein
MASRLWQSFRRLYRFALDRLSRSAPDSACSFSLGKKPGEEALAFSDSLDFDRGCFESLLDSKQPFPDLARN